MEYVGDRLNLFFILILILAPACASFETLVTKKEFNEYKSLNELEHTEIRSGFLFDREDIRKTNEDIKGIYKELDNLNTLYMQLDMDMIDYLWHKNNVIQVR